MFPFSVPNDLAPGVHIFAWAWYNREQELGPFGTPAVLSTTSEATTNRPSPTYRTANGLSCVCQDPKDISTCECACADNRSNLETREGKSQIDHQDESGSSSSLPFSSRPLMLMADVDNGCLTPKTNAELKFPEPGYEVVSGDGEYPLKLPEGDCTGLGQ